MRLLYTFKLLLTFIFHFTTATPIRLTQQRGPLSSPIPLENHQAQNHYDLTRGAKDWLVHDIKDPVSVTTSDDKTILKLDNGLTSRVFRLSPSFGTINLISHQRGGVSALRSIGFPEAVVRLDGIRYEIGGLRVKPGTQSAAFLDRDNLEFVADENAWVFNGHYVSFPKAPFMWTPGARHSPKDASWPPKGVNLRFDFKPPANVKDEHKGVVVSVHYEMYQGAPIISKWVSVDCAMCSSNVVVDEVVVETLGVTREYSPNLYEWTGVFINQGTTVAERREYMQVFFSLPYNVKVDWPRDKWVEGGENPILNVSYASGPSDMLQPTNHNVHTTFRCIMLLSDSYEPERASLSRRRMYRLLAPQIQENPMFFHLSEVTDEGVKLAVDQMAEVGFDMLIFSFGSAFRLESTDLNEWNRIKRYVDYANSKGIEVGGYDLVCMTRGQYGWSRSKKYAAQTETGEFGAHSCFASDWYDFLLNQTLSLFEYTGLSMIEADGPYPGTPCYSTEHTHHSSHSDSIDKATRLQAKYFQTLAEKGYFVNQPDWYFFQGSHKRVMGYSEQQFSLPRWEDVSVSRMGMYDDTYYYPPTMGWMFLPLTEYEGGGSAAEFEPFSEHRLEYEWALAQYLGYGVAACYRGPRLYDNEETKAMVMKWTTFYRRYRQELIGDVIHVRRADMQGVDAILHVTPSLSNKGLAMIFNPTSHRISQNLTIPLYYTGIWNSARVLKEGDEITARVLPVDREYTVGLELDMMPKSITWYLFQDASL
eukprot:comp20632_c0_seq1/m.26704 comp20632_c0_seq1/g.26704  ORF comp20632_c0_seq1/g.26704 comp20632_c0_seq1/m.26704 type:complete len:761 (-) comp20632_c0_seq1:19-2301(-)